LLFPIEEERFRPIWFHKEKKSVGLVFVISGKKKMGDIYTSALKMKVQINIPCGELNLYPGEKRISSILLAIDSLSLLKLSGTLTVTNLRIIWRYAKNKDINMSIPFKFIDIIRPIMPRSTHRKNRAEIEIKMSGSAQMHYFIFSIRKPIKKTMELLDKVISNFNESSLLRDSRFCTSIINNQRLDLLNAEYVVKKYDGLSNIVGRIGKTGVGFVTNFRFVWYSTIVENYNFSIPIIKINRLEVITHSRFTKCFYLSFEEDDKANLIGFTSGNIDILYEIVETFNKTRESAIANPMLTYPLKDVNIENDEEEKKKVFQEESFEIEENINIFNFFGATKEEEPLHPIVYDKFLGLSIEKSSYEESAAKVWEDASNSRLRTLAERINS
jgi:hypothetical protein